MLKNFIALGLIFAAAPAYALPLNPDFFAPGAEANKNAAVDFEGIIALSNCSGSLVRFTTSKDDDKAIVMTNGHCLGGGFLEPGEVVTNRAVTRQLQVLKPSDGTTIGRVNADMVLFATMTKTDITLYRVKETYKQIATSMNIKPLTLADRAPEVGEKIDIISGYWRRGYACAVEKIIHNLREGDWTFVSSIRYSRPGCETIGGTSGSPIILQATREVIGINNTGNEDGQRCTLNNPCEVDEQGNVEVHKGYSYGQQTHWIYGCLTANRTIDLNMAGCQLPK
jgi:hypothetical protein